jgi:hypothetical protein
VRDPSPPRLRPRAHTVPKYIWKRPAGDQRPTGGPLRRRDLKKRNQRGRRGDAVVLGESDDSVVGSAADLLEGSASPSWDGFGEDLHNKSAATSHWSTAGQHEAPFVLEETLFTVPEGRESAETTMNQEEARPPAAEDAAAAAAAAAAIAEAIELKQDEAEEILLSIDVTILSISERVTTKKIATEVCRKVEDATAALIRSHVFLLRRDRANHEADLGRRNKDALAQLSDVLVRLTALMDKEPKELLPSGSSSISPTGGLLKILLFFRV